MSSQNFDTNPILLDDTTRNLYNRAIADPSSLTDAERRTITNRPSPDEEDTLCRAACGLNMSELIAKAIEDSLTYNEACLLIGGLVPGQSERLIDKHARLNKADRNLTYRAMEAATTDQMKSVMAAGSRVFGRWENLATAAFSTMDDNDYRNIIFAMRIPWQEHILAQKTPNSGLVIFRTSDVDDDAQFASYKQQIEAAILHGFHLIPDQINEAIISKFRVHWIENWQDNPVSDIRRRFIELRATDRFPAGLRSDAFLYVDRKALQSKDTARPFVWLLEPDETTEPLKVNIKHIAPTLFARLTQRDLSSPEEKCRPYKKTSELAELHEGIARALRYNAHPDDIWPPPTRYM